MKIGRLGGGGSDYAAFIQHIGVPVADMSFGTGKKVHYISDLFCFLLYHYEEIWTAAKHYTYMCVCVYIYI